MIPADHVEQLGGGVELHVKLIAVERGVSATVDYSVSVWVRRDGFSKMVVGGAEFLPEDVVQKAKTKLWEGLKP